MVFVAPRWLTTAAWIVLGLGILERVVAIVQHPNWWVYACDGAVHWHLAQSIAAGRGFFVTDPFIGADCIFPVPAGPSHHFAPLLSVYEAVFILLFGPSQATLAASITFLSVGTVFIVYATTRDLFGPDAAVLVGAVIAHDWTLILYGTLHAYSENLVLATLTLTFWGIVKGLRDERYLLLAGLFAGLGYLARASVGWLFVVGGVAGFAWRFYYHGWAVLRNRHYLAAIGIFGTIVSAWSLRNMYHFWDGSWSDLWSSWQTSDFHSYALSAAVSRPGMFAAALLGKLALLGVALTLSVLMFLPEIRDRAKEWRNEAVSGLLLGAGLIFLFGWIFSAAFWLVEDKQLLWGHHIRYVMPALVPLLWLVVDRPAGRGQPWGWLVTILIAVFGMRVMPGLQSTPGALLGPT